LIERFWKFVRSKALNAQYYTNFKAFQAAIDEVCDQADGTYREELKTVLTLNFQQF
jgi:hypothetical protein